MSNFCNCRNTPRCNLKPGTQCCWDYQYPKREKKNVPDTPLPKPIDHGDGLPFQENEMKKKDEIEKFRIPLPKQRNQAFKSKKDYDRKDKSWTKNRDFSFLI